MIFPDLAAFQAQFPFAVALIVFCFGSIFGSFLNVVVYRLPIMLDREWRKQAFVIAEEAVAEETDEQVHSALSVIKPYLDSATETFNLVVPNSRCPYCDVEIKPWQNIPIIGYLIIRGRCAECAHPISARYPIVEAATGLISVVVIASLGLTMVGLGACVLTWALISLALIDYDTQLLPDDITLPMLWTGLIVNAFGLFTDIESALIGAIAGYMVLWTVFQLFRMVTGKDGMGFGDFKLLAALGAWLGWQFLPLIILLSSFAGAIIGGILIVFGRDRAKPIPFGPYLAIAGWIALIWGAEIMDVYLSVTLANLRQ